MVSNPCLEGCGLSAKCENRGQRPQLQWRLCRLVGEFVALVLKDVAEGHGFFVAGGADPGRGAERFSERLFSREPAAN